MSDLVRELLTLSTPERRKHGSSPDIAMKEAAAEIERLRAALQRLVAWGAACPTTREDRLSHAVEGVKAFHAARVALGEGGEND